MGIIRIIFVEDEPDIRSIVEMAMGLDDNIYYKSFEDGPSALRFVSETQQCFDMALLNFKLPFMTGIELHRQLRLIPILRNIVTAMVTAHVSEDITGYKDLGISGYILKPFDPISLAKRLRDIYKEGRAT